jgi:predicted 3-demethylubiquinone-9 3-methyltransferase (glyoxalase superfamily)
MQVQRITPCLWFDFQAEEAAEFYCAIFSNSRVLRISRYGDAGHEIHGRPSGSVMTVMFELDGQTFTALNGGPVFRFNEAISLQVNCDTQQELDHYWDRLSSGGDESAQQCGWLKDRYGLSWQIVPAAMEEMMLTGSPEQIARITQAFLPMKKLNLATLQRAYDAE